jgi:hypothetical protein
MTHDEANKRCEQLNRELRRRAERFFPRHTGAGEWQVASVRVLGAEWVRPERAIVLGRPMPTYAEDPRAAVFLNIPPFGSS